MEILNKKLSFLNKRNITGIYKIVYHLQREMLEINNFDERLLNAKFNTYDKSFLEMYNNIEGVIRDNSSICKVVSYNVNTINPHSKSIVELSILNDGKVSDDNKYLMGVLNILPHYLEYYTNKYPTQNSEINSNPFYVYIVNVIEVYIDIYLLTHKE